MRYEIEGGSLPAVVIHLEAGETIISENGGRTWSKGPIELETKGTGGIGKALGRMFSGDSLFLSYYKAQSSAEIGVASSFPGKILVRELEAGESLICQKNCFLCATEGVELSAHINKSIKKGVFGGEGFIMQRVTGPGTVFLEIDGYCKEYDLVAGEEVVCDTGALAVMDATCEMDVRMVKGMKNMFLGGEGMVDTVVKGPGKVYIQTITVAKLAQLVAPYLASDKK